MPRAQASSCACPRIGRSSQTVFSVITRRPGWQRAVANRPAWVRVCLAAACLTSARQTRVRQALLSVPPASVQMALPSGPSSSVARWKEKAQARDELSQTGDRAEHLRPSLTDLVMFCITCPTISSRSINHVASG